MLFSNLGSRTTFTPHENAMFRIGWLRWKTTGNVNRPGLSGGNSAAGIVWNVTGIQVDVYNYTKPGFQLLWSVDDELIWSSLFVSISSSCLNQNYAVYPKAGHFLKFCSRVLEINFGRDSRVSKIAFTEKILHTLHDFQLPAYQCEPDRHSTQSQTTLFRPTIQNAVIPSI